MLNYLKSNTVCYNLGFIPSAVVTINMRHFAKDNLLLLICVRLHEMIFDALDPPPPQCAAVSVLSAHRSDKSSYQQNALRNRNNSKSRFAVDLPRLVLLCTISRTCVEGALKTTAQTINFLDDVFVQVTHCKRPQALVRVTY